MPQQQAKLGFFHNPQDAILDKVCCFACGAEVSDFEPTWAFTAQGLMQEHEEDCVWAEMLRDIKLYVVDLQMTSLANALSLADSQPSVDTHTNMQPI
jgi:hypothetical protein